MDYNIYIHNNEISGSSGRSPIEPWSETSDGQGDAAQGIMRATAYAQNPDSIVSGLASKAMKALPWLAVAYAVIKATDSTIATASEFYATDTGDYRWITKYNNFKAGLKVCFTPFSSTVNFIKMNREIQIENQRKSMNRELLGDDIITGGSFYGV